MAGGAALLVLGVVAAAATVQERPVRYYTADPAAVVEIPIHAGFASNLGILFWWTGAVGAIFGWALLRGRRSRAASALLVGGLITAWLALDDFFVVHEELIPDLLGIPEKVVYAGYVLALVAYVVWFRRFFAGPRAVLLGCAAALFGSSIVLDVLVPGLPLLEDGAKLLGVAAWSALLVAAAADEILRERPLARAL